MRVLHLAPYSPVPPDFGGALRVYHILRGLARRHDVTFVAFGTEEDRNRLRAAFGPSVRHIRVIERNRFHRHHWLGMLFALFRGQSVYSLQASRAKMQEVIDQLANEGAFDIVLFEFPQMGRYSYKGGAVSILDEHNIEYSNFLRMYKGLRSPARRLLFFREYRKTLHEEIDVCKNVDGIFLTSRDDAIILQQHVPEKPKFIVPNGVDLNYFVPSEQDPDPYSMVFTGTMDYDPNRDAMFYFLDNIFPLVKRKVPRAVINIVGKNPSRELRRRAADDIRVTGYVDDVRPYAWRSSVYVVPLRMGGGTRLKILEGLAMRKPIVSTTIGCEGINVRHNVHVCVADDPETFANTIVELFEDRDKAKGLGDNGYALVKDQYSWDVIVENMDNAFTTLVEEKRGGAAPQAAVSADPRNREDGHPVTRAEAASTPVKVLMYHGLAGNHSQGHGNTWNVSAGQLRRHLLLLERWGYTCVTFEDYSLCLHQQLNLPRKPVIMTFDDGYTDIYTYALPILQEFGVRATAFVLGDRSIRNNSWDEPAGFEGATLMTDDQICALQKAGMEIGSHSLTHPDLTKIPLPKAHVEIFKSKTLLEDLVQAPIISFAYPFGASNETLDRMVKEAGYQYGCGVYSGPPQFSHDMFNIRRIPITSSTSIVDFALKILTPFEYFEWLRWEMGRRLHRTNTYPVADEEIERSGTAQDFNVLGPGR